MRQGQCPMCGSSNGIPNADLLYPGGFTEERELDVVVDEKPNAWLFKGEVRSSLKAWVCGDCGYTELYAKEAAALLAAYRKQSEPT